MDVPAPNPCTDWLSNESWRALCELDGLAETFNGLKEAVAAAPGCVCVLSALCCVSSVQLSVLDKNRSEVAVIMFTDTGTQAHVHLAT